MSPKAPSYRGVILKAGASVWPGAVLRGDNAPIVIGVDSNVKDGAVHVDPGCPVTLGRGVTIGLKSSCMAVPFKTAV